jgi:hypothetical protein
VCVLVGETIAWVMHRLSEARAERTQRMAQLEALVGAGAALECATDPGHLGDEVARVAALTFAGDASMALLGRRGRDLFLAGRWGTSASELPLLGVDPRLVTDTCDRGDPVEVEIGPEGSVLLVPLRASLRTIGIVAVARGAGVSREPDDFLLHMAQVFGSQAGLALERQHVLEHIHSADLRDETTGLGNRRYAELIVNSIRPGDGVVLLSVRHTRLDSPEPVRAQANGGVASPPITTDIDGQAVLGLFLAGQLRAADAAAHYDDGTVLVVMRGTGVGVHASMQRLAAEWRRSYPEMALSIGAVDHRPPAFPEDTLAAARRAM